MEHEMLITHIRKQVLKLILIFSIVIGSFFGVFGYVKSNTEIFEVKVDIPNNVSIKPDSAVSVFFHGYVNMEKTLSSIKIYPQTDFTYEWFEEKKELRILPKNLWKNGQRYELSIESGKTIFATSFDGEASFLVESLPQVISVFPTDGEKNVVIDIEDPITINFDNSFRDYDIKVLFNPMENFSVETDEQKKILKLMPNKDLKQGQSYDMRVMIRYKNSSSDDEFEKIIDSHFETKKMEIKEWSNNTSVRLFQAKNYTQPRILSGKYIDVNLKSQAMVLFEEGMALDSYLISSGKRGMDTPQGDFKIHNKHPRPWSKKYSLYMPYWMAITSSGEFGIHELPEWPGGYKEGANHLGIPVSHGCVRLGVGPAKRVYEWADIGTPVIIHQ